MNKRKFYIYSMFLFTFFIVLTSFSGLLKIGILSDTFGDSYTAVNSSFSDKITNNLEYIDANRYRPVLFLTLKGITGVNNLLGISYDNYIIYKLVNIFLYLLFALISGFIVLKLTGSIKSSILTEGVILFFPNNLHNLCWSAAYFEILCGIFILFALLYLIEYANSRSLRLLFYSNIFFILALLTKEIAITFPFVCFVILYVMHGKAVFREYKQVCLSELIILIVYFISKAFLSNSIPVLSGKYFAGDFWGNSFEIIFKAVISAVIPMDYSVLRMGIKEFNIPLIIYLFVMVSFLLLMMIKSFKRKEIIIITFNFLILISPYIYAGYIRPQLILIPFTITVIALIGLTDIRSCLLKNIYILLFISWMFLGYRVMIGWKTAYAESRERMETMLKTEFNFEKKIIIIGNPARMRQSFMYDNLIFPYNYFKYHNFIIKDKISDVIRTVALDEISLNSQFDVNKVNELEYEISCTGKSQYFFIDTDKNNINESGKITDEEMTIDILEFNKIGKPVKIKIKILESNSECFIFQERNLVKLN